MGAHPYSEHSSYITGAAVGQDEGWIAMAMDHLVEQNRPNSVFLYLKDLNFEMKHSVDFKTRFAGILPGSTNELIAVGELGNVAIVSQAGLVTEDFITIEGVTPETRGRGPLRAGAIVEGRVVVVGMNRQVYCREPAGTWAVMENGLPSGSKETTGFEGVAGKSLSSLYAVGWEGEIWKYNGSRWTAMTSPTDKIITGICVANDDRVFAVGREGALYRATSDQWEVLDTGCSDDLWTITCFDEQIYAASLCHLYHLAPDGRLDLIDPLGCPCFGPFSKCPQALWILGQKAVLSLSGKGWTQLA